MTTVRVDTYFKYDPAKLWRPPSIIEVGAFTIARAKKMLKLHPKSRIIIYEADPTNYATLQQRMTPKQGKPDKRISSVNAAITAHTGEVTFYRFNGYRHSHSIYPRHEKNALFREDYEELTVPATTLGDALNAHGIDRLSLLLLNCEGAELDILTSSLEDGTLPKRVGQMCVSFHPGKIYPGQKSEKVIKQLCKFYDSQEVQKANHYYLFTLKNFKR